MATPEQQARENIDRLLEASGWQVQDIKHLNLGASCGVAVREFPLKDGAADYLLFADRQAVGVVEAKKEGVTLSGVAEQSSKYILSFPDDLPHVAEPLPFHYESTGIETYFRDTRDPDARSRQVFSFHRPEQLEEWSERSDTLRLRLQHMPALITEGLRECQIEAVTKLEKSFAANRPRALIQMATGAGKTFTAVTFVYRLLKFAKAKRVLFLVDRCTLGKQTLKEFQQYVTPDDGRKFTELYNVQHMTRNTLDPVCKVTICTIQRLYSMLRGEAEFDESLEEGSMFDSQPVGAPSKDVVYNTAIPPETFDFVVTDECHRSIYNLWRQVLEYFDCFTIGLTATPSKQTLGFFHKNLVMEYGHERAVADGVNVDFEVYRIRTQIGDQGGKVDAGYYIDKRDKMTREVKWEKLDDDLSYTHKDLDRSVVAPDQIRTVIRAFRDKLFSEIFPGRTEVPKTLVFAKDDSHAEDIVHIIREEFGKGNDFCKKITYRTTGEKPEELIASFRNSYNPRIAVSVDMISTGTDIKPLECLLFMRDVRSLNYFEQMKVRGTRVISQTDLQAVTPDTESKTHFVIVDAVGICESKKVDTKPLEKKRTVSFDKLLLQVAMGKRDEDTLSSLACRLSRLDRELGKEDRQALQEASGGKSLRDMANNLLDAIDPDKQIVVAQAEHGTPEPTEEQVKAAAEQMASQACAVFDDPALREKLIDAKRKSEQVIDNVSIDTVTFAGHDEQAKEKAKGLVTTWERFIEENKDEITALQMFFAQPYGQRHLTYEQVKELAEAIRKPPYMLSTDRLWTAYEQLEKSKVKGARPEKLLTDIISLVRFAIHEAEVLEPFNETVNIRFAHWLEHQEAVGKTFTEEQMAWLKSIRDHITTSLTIEMDDLELAPFHEKGGPMKAYQLFGDDLNGLLDELNRMLVA